MTWGCAAWSNEEDDALRTTLVSACAQKAKRPSEARGRCDRVRASRREASGRVPRRYQARKVPRATAPWLLLQSLTRFGGMVP